MSFELRPRGPVFPVFMAAWTLAVVSIAGCTQAAKKRREPVPSAPAASAPVATAPAAPAAAGAAAASAPATAPALRRGLDPRQARGKMLLQLSLPAAMRLGGFAFTATYDADKFHVAEPVTAPSMQGYLCQANLAQEGLIRFNCAGLVNEDRGGLLATFDVSFAQAAPTPADFTVTQSEVVNDLAAKVDDARVAVAVVPAPAP